ncbi:MAG: ABC transporter substrate-binding protein [Solirubrobacteraceae bacterium]|nr:ABC transporter substrate-binding protein [Solirubrobacteraceae bacterium]
MTRIPRPRRTFAALVACGALTTAVASCGELEETGEAVKTRDQVTLVLDYFPNANHAAIYAAQSTGAFERAGLDVTIQPPNDASTPLKTLEAGQADFVVSYEPEVLLARDKGSKIQAVQALVQTPLTAVISLAKKPIRTAENFENTTIGTAGLPSQAAYLETILSEGRVDPAKVKRVDLGFNLTQPLVAGRVDASLGAFWNYEAIQLQREKKSPVTVKIEDLGVPTYNELVLTSTEETVRSRGPLVRRMVQAIGFGAKAVQKDPTVGVDAVMAAGGKGLDRGLQEASLEATLPVMFPKDTEHPFGWMDSIEWAQYARWMETHELITTSRVSARAITNEYLAGEGVGDKTSS